MNIYTIVGIILIALGTFLTYFGSTKDANLTKKETQKLVNDKVSEVLTEFQKLEKIDTTGSQSAGANKIAEEFLSWAANFKENIDSFKLNYEKQKLEDQADQLEYCKKWHYMYDIFFGTLKNLIEAYNTKTNSNIECKLDPPPVNFLSPEVKNYRGYVKFRNDLYWNIQILSNYVSQKSLAIYISVQSENGEEFLSSFDLFIAIRPLQDMYVISFEKDSLYVGGIKTSGKISEYPDIIKTLLKRCLEKQLI